MRDWKLALFGLTLAVVDVGVPYLLFENVADYWVNYLFWSLLTLSVILVGIWRIRKWGEE